MNSKGRGRTKSFHQGGWQSTADLGLCHPFLAHGFMLSLLSRPTMRPLRATGEPVQAGGWTCPHSVMSGVVTSGGNEHFGDTRKELFFFLTVH